MQKYTLLFPGDPPITVLRLSRAEFLRRFPRSPVQIETHVEGHTYIEKIELDEGYVHCDFCNDDPGEEVWVYHDCKGYCRKCAERQWFPYLRPKPEHKPDD